MIKREFERKFILKENNTLLDKEFIEHAFDSVSNYKKIFNEHAVNINQGYIKEQYAKQLLCDLCLDLKYDVENFKEYRLRSIDSTCFYYTMKTTGIFRNEFEIEIEHDIFSKYWTKVHRVLGKKRLYVNLSDCVIMIDRYKNKKLTLIEVESDDLIVIKDFFPIGLEVTNNSEYYNYNLAKEIK